MCVFAGMSSSAWATVHTSSHDHISTPATIPLTATATPAAGTTITRIEVYSGTTLISTSNGSTLNANWITLKPGTQTLTARAIDSNGGISTASVTITVTSAANETITFIHNDLAGSPMAATDINGAIVWKEDYSPYGERKQNEAASSNQHQWFGGKLQDSETGLSYFGARYYDPVVGRFMGVDAVGFNPGNLQSFNRYAYANNNPYKFVDPDGNEPQATIGAAPPNFFRDTFVGGVMAKQVAPLALLLPNNVNPLTGYIENFSGDKKAEAAISLMVAPLIGALRAEASFAKQASAEITTLFRAVSGAEAKQVAATGTFEAGSNSLGGKWFAETLKDAQRWGDTMNGAGNSKILRAEIPKAQADKLMKVERLDGIGPARYGELNQLSGAKISEF
jgi:RHS repeat-associated protein